MASSTAWSAEALDELGIGDKAVGVAPVGCAVFAYDYFNCDMMEAAHGRAPAVATGIKRVLPEHGPCSPIRATATWPPSAQRRLFTPATRGEKITVIFVNNAIYGMTGGQMAPTTLPGQETTTSPYGRDVESLRLSRARQRDARLPSTGRPTSSASACMTCRNIKKAKAAIKKAFQLQMEGQGLHAGRGTLHLSRPTGA